jgi:hypothetical protein
MGSLLSSLVAWSARPLWQELPRNSLRHRALISLRLSAARQDCRGISEVVDAPEPYSTAPELLLQALLPPLERRARLLEIRGRKLRAIEEDRRRSLKRLQGLAALRSCLVFVISARSLASSAWAR